jgi:23S rRNA pseudouridine2604 synthase
MARTTLKLPKAVDRTATPKASTSRARRAQQSIRRSTAPATLSPLPKPSTTASPPRKPSTKASTPRTPAPVVPRPPAHENPDDPRLSKRMSELGLCSRREADEYIENGWVKVDGKVVATLGVRVPRDARIEIDPAAARHQSEQVTILLNKPVGYVSGQPEDGHEPAMVLIKPENRWADDPSPMKFRPGHLRGLAPAGRLDIDSTGLIVFTQDGRVAKRLIGSDSEVEKEYLVRVEGTLTDEGMRMLHHGLELDGVKLKPARVSWANENQLRFVLREGRKRQIRRMCERVGLVVTGLKRVRSGGVPLGPLPVGQWRYLRRDEKF